MPVTARRSTDSIKRGLLPIAVAAALIKSITAFTAPSFVDPSAGVAALADEILVHRRAHSAYLRFLSKLPVEAFDPITYERAQDEARFNAQLLARLRAMPLEQLPHEKWLLAMRLEHMLSTGAEAEENYWLDFAVTPYAGALADQVELQILQGEAVKTAADREDYLRLVDSYATQLEQIEAKTRAQAKRGIRVAQPAIRGVVELFKGLSANAENTLVPSVERLQGVAGDEASAFRGAVLKRVVLHVRPEYEAIAAIFDDEYVRAAPAEVGIWKYPGGKERYVRLISEYTGLKLDVAQIHDLGRRRVAELDVRLAVIRKKLGFAGSREAFNALLRKNPRFVAKSPEEVRGHYLQYISSMSEFIPRYFSNMPRTAYAIRRLAPALEGDMTYGYYESPTANEPRGIYYFNGSDLAQRPLIGAQTLIYHELIPGHHVQICLQLENQALHPAIRLNLGEFPGFEEGWAEYAASLGEEMGVYADPYEMYGHLVDQAFIASRLVVDTGMNYFGMPLEEARRYSKQHTMESDEEIRTETLRYSTDFYAQALVYRLGYEKFWELRHRAEAALGRRFDVRDFHDALLGEGAMPLDVLDEHVNWFIEQRLARR